MIKKMLESLEGKSYTNTLAHISMYIYPAIVILNSIPGLIFDFWPAVLARLVLLTLMILTLLSVIVHQDVLCPICMSKIKIDSKDYLWCKIFHNDRRIIWISLCLVATAQLVLWITLKSYHLSNIIIAIPLSALCAFLLISYSKHKILRPWCPFCKKWDEDGNHEPVPEIPQVRGA
jgi:hypothetical protein